ncbi:ATP-dependent DNA helicase Q4 [Xenopus tropicalis]|uniref:ATP-dependent DNA helicase Q4 n=2 Tax=Xenopus tropicalis TaxID=8364 RepID=A0JM06_XENTR|nr:ATP-dependent DNA helicase Q4 [Xenopus tropicalis]AAI25689.1 hypothetical protein MGC145453 [Xenopus tropicalis]|eukprot:NP_001072882.1 ATP-dependent DNA helicase Q4 [Xenopus tropicalis]
MERYNQVKVLLKNWETAFLQEHKRRPNKTDVENASNETQELYKEYRSLKQGQLDVSTESVFTPKSGQVASPRLARSADAAGDSEGSASWGSHLNRACVTPKLTPKERDSLKASAQFYGMKLKANLGGASKERPVSLKKSFTPRSRPAIGSPDVKTRNHLAFPKPPGTPISPPELLQDTPSEPSDTSSHISLKEPPPKPAWNPSALGQPIKKQHQLQAMVGQRMASLNQEWLQRCELRNGAEPMEVTAAEQRNVNREQCDSTWEPLAEGAIESTDLHITSNNDEFAHSVTSPTHSVLAFTPGPSQHAASPSLPLTFGRLDKSPEKPKQKAVETPGRNSIVRSRVTDSVSSRNKREGVWDPDQQPLERKFPVRQRICVESKASLAEAGMGAHNQLDSKGPMSNGSKQLQDIDVGQVMKNRTRPRQQSPQEVDGMPQETIAGGEASAILSKGKRKKRQREISAEQDAVEESPKVSKKRRKTKMSPDNGEKSSPVQNRRKRGARRNDSSDDPSMESPASEQGAKPVSEDLFGELEEETAQRISVKTAKATRMPQIKSENFVRINLKKKSHVKSFALNGQRLRKQMWKQKWQKKGEQFGGGGKHFNRGGDTCFRCGGIGHWASQCPGSVPVVRQEVVEIEEEEEVSLPTLEDVARMTNTQLQSTSAEVPSGWCQGPVATLNVVRAVYEPPEPPSPMQALYELEPDGKVKETPAEVYDTLSELGYSSFRPGQEQAVMRILSGLSSLVILSTGMGKSLCYQLPAYMYAKRSRCITLVISPLVSLMDDQVSGLPPKLKAVCIHSNMTRTQRETAIEKVKQGKVHVLLLSPEALVGGGQSGSSCLPPAEQLPPVAFACIDEAHCVSEWSHNFRPCYLRLCKVLRERLGVNCLLGLTATATRATAEDVARHLGVSQEGGIPVRMASVPPNLHLSVSMDRNRDQALVTLLKGERFGCLDSVIVYCTRREETQRISALLRTSLQGVTVSNLNSQEQEEATVSDRKKAQALKKIRRPLKWIAESYHAGMSAAERRRVQNNFMCGQLRLVVATVAFGMGLDKSDVRGIIHYNMPKNFESYVQEIGRAGRDGKDAQCHLFLDPEEHDMDELRRHIYSDSVDCITVKRLVQKVFPKCKCRDLEREQQALTNAGEVEDSELLEFLAQSGEEQDGMCDTPSSGTDPVCDTPSSGRDPVCDTPVSGRDPVCDTPIIGRDPSMRTPRLCHRHERAIPIEETVQGLDIREEAIETLLCYLELHPSHWLEQMHPTLSHCRVVCYSGPQQLRQLASSCPPVAVCLARERLAGVDHTHVSSVEFNVVELADSMGWEMVPVKRALRDLQWKQQPERGFKGTGRSGVLVEFGRLSFHFRSYGDLTDQELDEVCDFLHQKVTSRERTSLNQLKSCFRAFQSVAYRTSSACAEQISAERSAQLKALLWEYFEKRVTEEAKVEDPDEELREIKLQESKDQVRSDIRHFLSIHQEERFSGRALARIFHGIGSPCYPAQVFGRDRRFWRKYIHLDFNELMNLSKEEIIRLK